VLIEADDILVRSTFELGKARYPFPDGLKFAEHALLGSAGVTHSVQPLRERLMDCRRLADPLAPRKLIDQRYRSRIFDIQRHENLQKSTFYKISTVIP